MPSTKVFDPGPASGQTIEQCLQRKGRPYVVCGDHPGFASALGGHNHLVLIERLGQYDDPGYASQRTIKAELAHKRHVLHRAGVQVT
jgi:hypothetical protein